MGIESEVKIRQWRIVLFSPWTDLPLLWFNEPSWLLLQLFLLVYNLLLNITICPYLVNNDPNGIPVTMQLVSWLCKGSVLIVFNLHAASALPRTGFHCNIFNIRDAKNHSISIFSANIIEQAMLTTLSTWRSSFHVFAGQWLLSAKIVINLSLWYAWFLNSIIS